jgi:AcrR family transcriptional regulator
MGAATHTRARLQEAALTLFTERGYEATTVEQIAGAAGVSHMTFFRHFPTKESVVLDDPFDPAIAAAVLAQPAGLSTLVRVCAGLRTALAELDLPEQEQVRARVRIAAGTASLRAGMWSNTAITQQVIADALATDGVPELEARVVVAAVIGALTVALQDWSLLDADTSLAAQLLAALDVLDPPGA